MSTDSIRQHQSYVIVYAGHVLSTVITMEDDDRAEIDPRGYENAYEVVARRLERRIRRGEFPWHAPLPSEPDLSDWYGVSRTTVRSAIDVLAGKGMVEKRRGKGTYVTWRPDASHDASPDSAG